jgi:hypothetical protein
MIVPFLMGSVASATLIPLAGIDVLGARPNVDAYVAYFQYSMLANVIAFGDGEMIYLAKLCDGSLGEQAVPQEHVRDRTGYLDQGDQHAQRELRSGLADPFAPDLDGIVRPDTASQDEHHCRQVGAQEAYTNERDRATQ